MAAVDHELQACLASLERCSISVAQTLGYASTLRSIRLMRLLLAWRLQAELSGELSAARVSGCRTRGRR